MQHVRGDLQAGEVRGEDVVLFFHFLIPFRERSGIAPLRNGKGVVQACDESVQE
jgi:hypothetical protein